MSLERNYITEEEYVSNVKAQVMTRDDSKGGWVPLGSGGMSLIGLCKVTSNAGSVEPRIDFRIHGRRISDKKIILSCTLKKDLQYTKANPTFHHWKTESGRFGLTFQSSGEARVFEKNIRKVVDSLKYGYTEPVSKLFKKEELHGREKKHRSEFDKKDSFSRPESTNSTTASSPSTHTPSRSPSTSKQMYSRSKPRSLDYDKNTNLSKNDNLINKRDNKQQQQQQPQHQSSTSSTSQEQQTYKKPFYFTFPPFAALKSYNNKNQNTKKSLNGSNNCNIKDNGGKLSRSFPNFKLFASNNGTTKALSSTPLDVSEKNLRSRDLFKSFNENVDLKIDDKSFPQKDDNSFYYVEFEGKLIPYLYSFPQQKQPQPQPQLQHHVRQETFDDDLNTCNLNFLIKKAIKSANDITKIKYNDYVDTEKMTYPKTTKWPSVPHDTHMIIDRQVQSSVLVMPSATSLPLIGGGLKHKTTTTATATPSHVFKNQPSSMHDEAISRRLLEECLNKRRCVHCRKLFLPHENRRGACEEATDPWKQCVEKVSCCCCAKALIYHCFTEEDEEGDDDDDEKREQQQQPQSYQHREKPSKNIQQRPQLKQQQQQQRQHYGSTTTTAHCKADIEDENNADDRTTTNRPISGCCGCCACCRSTTYKLVKQWTTLVCLSLCVPCFCCYFPLLACHKCALYCGLAGARHEPMT